MWFPQQRGIEYKTRERDRVTPIPRPGGGECPGSGQTRPVCWQIRPVFAESIEQSRNIVTYIIHTQIAIAPPRRQIWDTGGETQEIG